MIHNYGPLKGPHLIIKEGKDKTLSIISVNENTEDKNKKVPTTNPQESL